MPAALTSPLGSTAVANIRRTRSGAMLKLFAIDTADAAIEPDLIAAAQEEGQTPEEFALWCANVFAGSMI